MKLKHVRSPDGAVPHSPTGGAMSPETKAQAFIGQALEERQDECRAAAWQAATEIANVVQRVVGEWAEIAGVSPDEFLEHFRPTIEVPSNEDNAIRVRLAVSPVAHGFPTACERYGMHILNGEGVCVSCGKPKQKNPP